MDSSLGALAIEEFTLEAARECDVVFLAVSGDFALEWAEKISENDGPLVIDNSSAFRRAAFGDLVRRRGGVGACTGETPIPWVYVARGYVYLSWEYTCVGNTWALDKLCGVLLRRHAPCVFMC
eukprot:6207768-Pleurochrysis_carterae.AAC.1